MKSDVILSKKLTRREGTNRTHIEVRVVRISENEYEIATVFAGEDIPDEFLSVPDQNMAIYVSRGAILGLRSVGFEED